MEEISVDTLGKLRDGGYTITAYCLGRHCRRSARLDLDALIVRLGYDFVVVGDPPPLVAKLRCSACGGKDLQLGLGSPNVPTP